MSELLTQGVYKAFLDCNSAVIPELYDKQM